MTEDRHLENWDTIWLNMPDAAWTQLAAFLRQVDAYEAGRLPADDWPGHPLKTAFEEHVAQPGHFTVIFDWMPWDEGQAMVDAPRPLESADAKTCCMFLSAIVRAERFTTGILRSAFESGAVQTAARRLHRLQPV